jgi:NADH dehydrogenase
VILVVGATGQVGSAVVRRLRERGEEVTALVRASTDPGPVAAAGARIVHGDLRDPGSLGSVCEGADAVVATANTIVPRRGERADFDAIARGYEALGRVARAAGVARLLFLSVPREFIGRGALDFDAKGRIEDRLQAEGPPLTVVRSSPFMELWLPWLGSRLPLRGVQQATIERGFWLARLAGATAQQSLDRFGIALLPGKGTARHAFIAVDDVAEALVAAATGGDEISQELRLGGPEALSWREVAEVYGRVLSIRVRTIRQPIAPFRALATGARAVSPAASQNLAAQTLLATIDTAYPPDDARRLLGREPTSVEVFLSRRRALG